MKLDEVVKHFLNDARLNNRTDNTLTIYQHGLSVLLRLLEQGIKDTKGSLLCITELEQVTVFHLRECVRLLSTPLAFEDGRVDRPAYRRGRRPVNGSTLSVTSIRSYVRVWKAFFHWCYQEELIESNIVARLKMPKPEKRVIVAFTEEHIERMIASCDISTGLGFRDYVIVMLLLDTGIRLSEICGLRVGDIHDGYIKVFGKGRKEREVGIYPEVGKLLWKYIHKYRKPANSDEAALFIGRHGEALQVGGVKQIIERVKEDSGIGGVRVSAHTFRHTFAKMYLDQGGELFKLSRELGHSDIQVTAREYLADFGSSEARKDHNSYSPIAYLRSKKQKQRKQKKQ